MTASKIKGRTPFRKVRISAITSHALPLSLVHGFALSSVALNEMERVVGGGVHSRHILRTPMDCVALFLHATLFLTGDEGKLPVHVEMSSCTDITSVLESLGRELAMLTTGAGYADTELMPMAAANIALCCFNAAGKSGQTDMLCTYLQSVVGLFETEGAVATLYKAYTTDSTEIDYAHSGTNSPEQVCQRALQMLFALISGARLSPDDAGDPAFRSRRGVGLYNQHVPVCNLATSKFLSTINDRAPIFWVECDNDDEDLLDLTDLQGHCIRVME